MAAADLAAVVRVAVASFPDHFEGLACFAERLRLCPELCFSLELAGEVEGYLIAYPWPDGEVPPLNSLLGALPADRRAIYLHDLALAPAARGRGHAREALDRLVAAARSSGAQALNLVSVNGSQTFWRGFGFETHDSPVLRAKLASYGADARYMTRQI